MQNASLNLNFSFQQLKTGAWKKLVLLRPRRNGSGSRRQRAKGGAELTFAAPLLDENIMQLFFFLLLRFSPRNVDPPQKEWLSSGAAPSVCGAASSGARASPAAVGWPRAPTVSVPMLRRRDDRTNSLPSSSETLDSSFPFSFTSFCCSRSSNGIIDHRSETERSHWLELKRSANGGARMFSPRKKAKRRMRPRVVHSEAAAAAEGAIMWFCLISSTSASHYYSVSTIILAACAVQNSNYKRLRNFPLSNTSHILLFSIISRVAHFFAFCVSNHAHSKRVLLKSDAKIATAEWQKQSAL